MFLNTNKKINNLDVIHAPWNKTVTIQNVHYEGGLNMLRFRIKEGKRFTDLELDLQSLKKLNLVLTEWFNLNSGNS